MRTARAEEIDSFRWMKSYTKVPMAKCRRNIGRGPVEVPRVDVNKKDEINPTHRSRLEAGGMDTHSMPEMCAASPPPVSLRAVVSCAVWTNTCVT